MENLTEHLNCICVFVEYHLLWLIWWEYGAHTWLEEKKHQHFIVIIVNLAVS